MSNDAIQATHEVVEISSRGDGAKKVNEYLNLGWTLIDTFVVGYGDPRDRNETMHYVLGWQAVGEPQRPNESDSQGW
jgi:hypothetical protein